MRAREAGGARRGWQSTAPPHSSTPGTSQGAVGTVTRAWMFRPSPDTRPYAHLKRNCLRGPRCPAGSSWLSIATSPFTVILLPLWGERHTSHHLELYHVPCSPGKNLPCDREPFQMDVSGDKLHSIIRTPILYSPKPNYLLKSYISKMHAEIYAQQLFIKIYIIFTYFLLLIHQ